MTENKPGPRPTIADTDFTNPDILDRKPYRDRRCPVMVTISNCEVTAVDIQQLLEVGTNIVRLKMTDSSEEDRINLLQKIIEAAENCCIKYGVQNWPVATCVALKNLVCKTGILENEEGRIKIEANSQIILTSNMTEYNKCNSKQIFINNPMLTEEVKIGTEISINSDEIIATCTEILDEKSIKCDVIKGGILVNICDFCARDIKRSRPFMSKKDLEIIDFILENEIDIIIMNYVRDAESVKQVKEYIGERKNKPIMLSGIATMEGLINIDDIIKVSDGIILSREFLPYELSAANKYRLPNIQKWLAAKCFQAGKPFFICGGIFEEALLYGTFRSAQISDITNAILDGVTGFIFKNSTPTTELTVKLLTTLNELCYSVEPLTTNKALFLRTIEEMKMPVNAAEAAVMSCAMAARQTNSRAIIIPTVSGRTVKALHWMKPSCTIITVSSKNRISRLLHTYRGVIPLLYAGPDHSSWKLTVEAYITYALEYGVKRGKIKYGDPCVILRRSSEFSSFCDMVFLNKVSLRFKPLIECPEKTRKKRKKKSSTIDRQN